MREKGLEAGRYATPPTVADIASVVTEPGARSVVLDGIDRGVGARFHHLGRDIGIKGLHQVRVVDEDDGPFAASTAMDELDESAHTQMVEQVGLLLAGGVLRIVSAALRLPARGPVGDAHDAATDHEPAECFLNDLDLEAKLTDIGAMECALVLPDQAFHGEDILAGFQLAAVHLFFGRPQGDHAGTTRHGKAHRGAIAAGDMREDAQIRGERDVGSGGKGTRHW